jgi:hypothetical protein
MLALGRMGTLGTNKLSYLSTEFVALEKLFTANIQKYVKYIVNVKAPKTSLILISSLTLHKKWRSAKIKDR